MLRDSNEPGGRLAAGSWRFKKKKPPEGGFLQPMKPV
jgi:hypothetical protein